MAIVTRYFSTTSAGAGDGTSWADRAALFSSGNWSSVITGFDFSGSDSLLALIGPGTYSCGQSLASGLFSNAPTSANPLLLYGCDSSGNRLAPSNPDWTSDQPVDWDSALPVIATTTNITTINLGATLLRLLKFTASGANTATISGHAASTWISVINSTNNSSAVAINPFAAMSLANIYSACSGAAYSGVISGGANIAAAITNVRIVGVAGSSGNRRGLSISAFAPSLHCDRVTVIGVGGEGIYVSGQSAVDLIRKCIVASVGGNGVQLNRSTSSTKGHVTSCVVAGSGGYGIAATTTSGIIATSSRFRDNTSGNFSGFDNYPTDWDNDTSSGSDADEFVDAANGDYRIKYGSTLWGKGYGVSDEPAPAGGGGGRRPRLVTVS